MANNRITILKALEAQTASWIVLGLFAVLFYPIVFFNWELINRLQLVIPLGFVAIAGTMVWWFWTMKIIFTLLKLQREESMSLDEILREVKAIRLEVQKEIRENLDK